MEQNPKKIKKIKRFVEKHFPDATSKKVSGGEEYRFLCPFCRGGRTREVSFDLNPVRGACRCWRASCGWRSSIEWFVKHYLGVSYPRAVEIVGAGEAGTVEEVMADLKMLEELNTNQIDEDYGSEDVVTAWIDGATPLDESDWLIQKDVKEWIENKRGYDFEEFSSIHEIWVPPQIGAYEDRVLFSIECRNSVGYLLYAIDNRVEPKTLNPSGKVLSNMIYRWDEIKNSRVVFVCEGFFDAARLTSYGYNATCLFTTYISNRQAFLLSEMAAEEICFIFDHGVESLAREAAKLVSEYSPDKDLSVINICEEYYIGDNWKDGIDPDDLTEDEFLAYYSMRSKKLNEEQKLQSKLHRVINLNLPE